MIHAAKLPPTFDEQQTYYNRRWSAESVRPNRLELLRLIEVLSSLHDTGINFSRTPARTCDLGCGRGWLSNQI